MLGEILRQRGYDAIHVLDASRKGLGLIISAGVDRPETRFLSGECP
jgi:hypothetical protein